MVRIPCWERGTEPSQRCILGQYWEDEIGSMAEGLVKQYHFVYGVHLLWASVGVHLATGSSEQPHKGRDPCLE